jgi:WD40 repeat protein
MNDSVKSFKLLIMKPVKIFLSATASLLIMDLACAQETAIETVVQTGHYAAVQSVAFSPDGMFAATGSADKTIKLWEVENGREIRSYLGNIGAVWVLAFSPDGKLIASVDGSYNLSLWEVETSKKINSIEVPEDDILSVAFSPDGKYLVTGTENNHAIAWDLMTGTEVRKFNPEITDIPMEMNFEYPTAKSVQFSPDGKILLTGSNDHTGFLFDFNTGKQIRKFKYGKSSCVTCAITASFSSDGRRIVFGHFDSVFICDSETARVLLTMKEERGSYETATFSKDGKYISALNYGTGYLWDAQNGKLITTIGEDSDDLIDIRFSPDNDYILSGGKDKMSKLWKIPSGRHVMTLRGYLNDIDAAILDDSYMYWVAFMNEIKLSPDGKYLAIGKTGNNARLMDFNTGKLVRTFVGHENIVISLDFSPDGKYLATGSADGTTRIWEVESGKMVRSLPEGTSNLPNFSIDFSPDGNWIVVGSWDGLVRIWDIKTGELIQAIRAHNDASPYSVQFSHNGLYILSGGLDSKLKIFEIDTGSEVKELIGHTDVVSSIRRHPNGTQMISTSWDGRVKIWDIASGMQVRRFTAHDARVQASDIDATGKYLVTGSDDNTARLWDIAESRLITTFTGHAGTVSSVNISPDGKYLITGSHDGTIKSWDMKTGKEMLTFIFIGENDWLIKTKEGFFDASEGAKKLIFFVKGTQIYNIDQFFEEFYRPGLLNEVLRTGGQIRSDADLMKRLEESPPPSVTIVSPFGEDTARTSTIPLKVRLVNNGGGIQEIRIQNNGKSLPVDNTWLQQTGGEAKYLSRTINVELVPGENEILVSAFSFGRIESKPDNITVYNKGPERVINCYLVAIGINEYRNPALDLNYARADAEAFSNIIQDRSSGLFKKIEIHELVDTEATKSNILSLMDELSRIVKPEDVLLFYYAGHGSMVENKFFFIPTESVSLYQEDKLNKESIYAGIIQEKFKNIPALKQIVILDACQSGGSTEILAQRGASEEKALAQLSRGSGVHVLAASGSEQFAAEVSELGHGVFTYILLDALKGSADGAPKDGNVTIYELKAYLNDQVPELTEKYKGTPQWPYTFSIGHDFPIVRE